MIHLTKTPTLMVQGTTSNAGKSVLVAGLCRLFRDQGYRVAPFKPQNMALNSAVTVDGGEIGRSQAVQAQACGIAPHTDMNPILLKPNSDTGAQVIIQGKAIGNMDAVTYHRYKKQAMEFALESYYRLAAQYDMVIIEGAGSPAEINLRDHDIANMGFATAIDCSVILVADIDRGGVFAHLLGTLACLSAKEKELLKGFVINRFRGDVTLLDSGIDWLTKKTNVDTLGVLPFLEGLHIEAEDAVDKRSMGGTKENQSKIKIVVPRIPRISNHTDFDVLRLRPDAEVCFVEKGETIPGCDLIILPGSKSTISDFEWLTENGWPAAIRRHLRYGGKLIGICGGYQMLGNMIHDPQGIEGPPGSKQGLSLMDFETTLHPQKTLTNVTGKLFDGHSDVIGYEIHVGSTQSNADLPPAVLLSDGQPDGAISNDNQILCTYLHGIFDHPEACHGLLKWAGIDVNTEFDYFSFKEKEIDRVSTMLGENLDIESLRKSIGL